MALGSASAAAGSEAMAQAAAVGRCEGCHDEGVNSRSNLTPRINGQRPHYIARRLSQLGHAANGRSAGIAKAHGTDDRLKEQLAQYFFDLKPTDPDHHDGQSLGARLYRNGIAARKVAACAYCHGANGEGSGPIPRLAGQHKAYLTIRLDLLSGIALEGSGAMHLAVKNVTPKEIDAITSYLAAQ